MRAFLEQATATPGLQTFQYELTLAALRDADLAPLARRQYEHYATTVADSLADLVPGASEQSLRTAARVVLAAVDGLILQSLADPDEAAAAVDAFLGVVDRLVADLLA